LLVTELNPSFSSNNVLILF